MRWKAWNEVEDDPKFCQTDWVRNNCLLLSQSPSVKITKTPPHPSPAVCCQQGLEDYLWAQHETTHGGLNLQSWGNISLIWESALRQTPPSSTGASRRPRTLCSKKTSHPCLPSPPSVLPYYPPGGLRTDVNMPFIIVMAVTMRSSYSWVISHLQNLIPMELCIWHC